jgi:aminopeptidase N
MNRQCRRQPYRAVAIFAVYAALVLAASPAGAATPPAGNDATAASVARIEEDVRFLASDELEGRGLGSPGLEQALRMVAARFAALGLAPAYPEKATVDDPLAGYFEPFTPGNQPASANVIGILHGGGNRQPGSRVDSQPPAAMHPGETVDARPISAASSPHALVIGAHVDHLGIEAAGTGDQIHDGANVDRIFNGADDNASGVAALLEIARILSATPAREDDRTVVFAVFSGEEAGLLGSRHFIAQPVVSMDELMVMINLDSVGHMRDRQVIVFGTATAREFPDALTGLNHRFGFDLVLRQADSGASDQTSFVAAGVPGLHFFTGPHEDYSRVSDTADKIDYAGLAELTDFVAELARYLRYRPQPLTFVAPKASKAAPASPLAAQGERRVSLGFMPDFTQESGGVKVGSVTPGGAAEAAGLKPGDVIVALDDEPVESLAEYAGVLRTHQPGEQISLTVRRDGQVLALHAVLQARQ